MTVFVAYYRVSTERQGRSGLGLEAQRFAARTHVGACGGEVAAEYVEVETGKGSNALRRRPQLVAALADAKKRGAKLLIAKLDRLSRNVLFTATLMESGVDFVCCDNPSASPMVIHILAAVAQYERDQTADRTKRALAAAKARGVKLGSTGAARAKANQAEALGRLAPCADALLGARARGLTVREIAAELNAVGVASPADGRWHASSVSKALRRLRLLPEPVALAA